MDDLLKEFELLSLPSRVNFDCISDNCIDKSLESFNYSSVYEALKKKGANASSIQWRKLREACLISKPLTIEFIIDVYEKSVVFSIRKNEWAECHIAMSKLIEFYCLKGFNTELITIIILFKFYYCDNVDEGMSEISSFLRLKLDSKFIVCGNVRSALEVCRLAAQGNYWNLSREHCSDHFNADESILVDLITERSKKIFAQLILKSYPIVSVKWISELLRLESERDDSKLVQDEIMDLCGVAVPLNEEKDKFILKRPKQK